MIFPGSCVTWHGYQCRVDRMWTGRDGVRRAVVVMILDDGSEAQTDEPLIAHIDRLTEIKYPLPEGRLETKEPSCR
jgi:hypothetical protein